MKIELFGKEILAKDYDCSFDKDFYQLRPPQFGLYLQVTELCNAHCQFCDKSVTWHEDNAIEYEKFTSIFRKLYNKGLIKYLSITGGEPFLDMLRLKQIINIVHKIDSNFPISLNTNGYDLESAKELKINELHISRHHYDDIENKKVFSTKVPSLINIAQIVKNFQFKVVFNCVLQKKLIDSTKELKKYLDIISLSGIEKVNFITLMPLTKKCTQLYVKPNEIIQDFLDTTNSGMLYSKDVCECFNFLYVSKWGIPVDVTVKNTKQCKCSYVKQLVYTAKNNLISGFGGEIIV